jgi:hypothetical protein
MNTKVSEENNAFIFRVDTEDEDNIFLSSTKGHTVWPLEQPPT